MIDRQKAARILGIDRDPGNWEHVLDQLEKAVVIDLNDPATENEVAEAIRRLAPEGAYVPLSERYPWRFSRALGNPEPVTIVDAVAEALRASASVHEAERIPHLVAPLIALAEALEHGALVPGPPPGRCGAGNRYGPPQLSCDLLAGHTGQHETAWREGRAYWDELP